MAESIKTQLAKYATIAHLIAVLLAWVIQTYGMPNDPYSTIVVVGILACLILVYRQDKDYRKAVKELDLTPQMESDVKRVIELILSLLGMTGTVEKPAPPEEPPLEPVDEPTREDLLARLKELEGGEK